MKYELKHDGKTIATLEDNNGQITPVYALLLMTQKALDEQQRKIQEENAEEIRHD